MPHRWIRPKELVLLLPLLASSMALAAPPETPVDGPTESSTRPADLAAKPTLTPEEKAARIAKATEHFKRGYEFYDKKKDYAAAYAEFLASMKYASSWSSTWFAARCLKQLRRYDDAVDMYETLFRDYEAEIRDKPKKDRENIQAEWDQLRQMVGFIDIVGAELDASIRIDGRNRGVYPARVPFRVATGFHTVRVYKENHEPFETSIDVAGTQVQTVVAKLRKLDLDQAGELRVSEETGRVMNVVIDGSVVGQTPWKGHLREGDHYVVLEGEDDWGTTPTPVHLNKGDTIPLVLRAELLEATIKIVPTPVGAAVAIDKFSVGRGVWQGKVRTGKHRIEVAADGYVLEAQDVSFVKGANEPIGVTLDRDPLSPLWKDNRGRVYVEAVVNPGILPSFGGDIVTDCGEACSSWAGIGGFASARGGYRFPSGFFVGLDVGYFYARQRVTERTASITPFGLSDVDATVNDTLSLRGALVGAAAGIRLSKESPVSMRLGVGALLGGRFRDRRTGQFFSDSTQYTFDATQFTSTLGLYVAPEVSLGFALAERLHVQAGVGALVLLLPAGNVPTWRPNDSRILAGAAGLATFGAEPLMGDVTVFLSPSASLRYEF